MVSKHQHRKIHFAIVSSGYCFLYLHVTKILIVGLFFITNHIPLRLHSIRMTISVDLATESHMTDILTGCYGINFMNDDHKIFHNKMINLSIV